MLTVKQVAEILGLATKTVYKLKDRGLLAFHQFGGAIRFSQEDVDDYIGRSRRIAPGQKVTKARVKLKGLRIQSLE